MSNIVEVLSAHMALLNVLKMTENVTLRNPLSVYCISLHYIWPKLVAPL